ncbi:MAG: hypothetical protein HYX24_05495 [Candidatus Aenigmarchaeota archaeon]|nr:hypothetical protein [Candidatus Aenigmarchaeota archaeon]
MKARISQYPDFLESVAKLLERRQGKASLSLDGMQFRIGKSKVRVDGNLEVTFLPLEKKD